MKKILNYCTFWGLVIALLIILMNYTGCDSYSIILIELNPLLNFMASFSEMRRFMNDGLRIPYNGMGPDPTISIRWYMGCVITFLLYGFVIDMIRCTWKRRKRK